MHLWTAFIIGFFGSLHCAGMCGPLVLAMPATSGRFGVHLTNKLAYNAGRIVTYGALGVLFGLFGQLVGLAGFQRWISIAAGTVILLSLLAWPMRQATILIAKPVGLLKSGLGQMLRRHGLMAQFSFGLLNGLLPCGLVYVACAAAAATASLVSGLQYMLLFGLGTVPMMLGLGLVGQRLNFQLQLRLRQLIPATLGIMATLLILRGMGLGIPYLSPQLDSSAPADASCCAPAPE
jgi:sulfite exporter TauE/SafE